MEILISIKLAKHAINTRAVRCARVYFELDVGDKSSSDRCILIFLRNIADILYIQRYEPGHNVYNATADHERSVSAISFYGKIPFSVEDQKYTYASLAWKTDNDVLPESTSKGCPV